METLSAATGPLRGKKVAGEPRPSRTLSLFEAVLGALDERRRLLASKNTSPQLFAPSLTTSVVNNENINSSLLLSLQSQIEAVTQLHQRYNWVLSQRQNASAREGQLLFGNSDSSQLVGSNGDKRRTMAATLQAIRAEMSHHDADLYAIEMTFETTVLGFLDCCIHGLAGFARLTPGSLFRLTLKHADQRWESRIITGKQNKQFIENENHRFQIVLDYSLGIKAEEERSFGGGGGSSSSGSSGSISSESFFRSILPRALLPRRLIGTVNFDILPLVNSMPQLLTISLNTSGSIKLHIIVKWVPPAASHFPVSKTDQLAFELQKTLALDGARALNNNSINSSSAAGSATFAARTGRRSHGISPKGARGSRTVRQHKSMSLNPNDVGALLSQLAAEDSEGGLTSDPSVMSSLSPNPSLSGSTAMTVNGDRLSTWSWLRSGSHSPRNEQNDPGDGSNGTMSKSLHPPGAGLDRIRALALHDLNTTSEVPAINRPEVKSPAIAVAKPATEASVNVSKDMTQVEIFHKQDLITSENVVESIFSLLGELRGRYAEVNEFEQHFLSLRSLLLPLSTSGLSQPAFTKAKSLALPGPPLRTSSMRQSIRRKKNHQDLQVNVEPSPQREGDPNVINVPKSKEAIVEIRGLASTGWPELDAAIASHTRRSLEDLQRLATVAFLPVETGNFAKRLVLDSLCRHTASIKHVFVPLVSAAPAERPILATNIAAGMLVSADSNQVWSALARSPSGLISMPSSTMHAELTKRLAAFRSQGPALTYGPSPNGVADRIVVKMTQYYSEYVNGVSLASLSKVQPASVVTLCDFAQFSGSASYGFIARLEDINEEMKFCHCLEPALLKRTSIALNDDSIYASTLQATRRTPSPMLIHALSNAAACKSNGAIAAAFRSSPPDWCHSLVNGIGGLLVWINNSDHLSKEATETRLAFISLLELLISSATISPLTRELIAVILSYMASKDSNDTVRATSRSVVIAMGNVGIAKLAKQDRSAHAFQGFGVMPTAGHFYSDDESIDEI